MSNPHWNNLHGANVKDPSPPEQKRGSPPGEVGETKTADWPGLPGKGGPDRSAGVSKHGELGEFYVLSRMSPEKHGTASRYKQEEHDKAMGASPIDRRGPKMGVPEGHEDMRGFEKEYERELRIIRKSRNPIDLGK